ncbi:MAG TPA: S49 family peptidase [Vicinamibacterales bacterium]|nr:S49 family peptidase [Vicinamibacterales bacterium]
MSAHYEHLLSFCLSHPWAVEPQMLATIARVLGQRIAGHRMRAEDLSAAIASRRALPQPAAGAVAVIPMYGVLAPRANLLTETSGMTSYDVLAAQVREMVKTDSIKTIVLDVDSPGGSVAGATELVREIIAARAKKPIVAVAQYTMASAAYWVASAATEIVAAPSAQIGSIGVFTIHEDLSKALEAEGITRTYITAGKYKVDSNETQPLAGDAKARLQRMCDDSLALFHADIAKGRGVAIDKVRADFGEGAVLSASEALSAGMVDRIATLDETVRRVSTGSWSRGAAAAVSEPALVEGVPDRLRRAREVEHALLEMNL